jgi:hypothetical protein
VLFDLRGLSDSIFGLTVVYAGLVMYDAQVYMCYILLMFHFMSFFRSSLKAIKDCFLLIQWDDL